jgi:hypothetical protein
LSNHNSIGLCVVQATAWVKHVIECRADSAPLSLSLAYLRDKS